MRTELNSIFTSQCRTKKQESKKHETKASKAQDACGRLFPHKTQAGKKVCGNKKNPTKMFHSPVKI